MTICTNETFCVCVCVFIYIYIYVYMKTSFRFLPWEKLQNTFKAQHDYETDILSHRQIQQYKLRPL